MNHHGNEPLHPRLRLSPSPSGTKVPRSAQTLQTFIPRPGACGLSQPGGRHPAGGAAVSCRETARGRVRQWPRQPTPLTDQKGRSLRKGDLKLRGPKRPGQGRRWWEKRPPAPRPESADASDRNHNLGRPGAGIRGCKHRELKSQCLRVPVRGAIL